MKNLAKKIAVAICVLAVLFSGCSNDVGGSLSNTNKLALLQYQKNNSGSNTTLSELKVIATSEDDVVLSLVNPELFCQKLCRLQN